MKARWKITTGLAAGGVLCAFLLWRPAGSARMAVEETRRALRKQGFKTDLAEFNFSTSEDLRARAASLTTLGHTVSPPRPTENLNLMTPVGSNAAIVVWKQDKLQSDSGEDLWGTLRESLGERRALYEPRPDLDAACEAALSGPIRFNLVASQGSGLLLPHLAALKRLAQTLGARAVLDLHDGNKDGAWTNLLATSRLITAWNPEPVEISHLVRFACATIAFNASWQFLQAGGWADSRLVELQREWESVDFFKGLPETAAFARASAVATCQLERQQPINRAAVTLNDAIHSPQSLWYGLTDYWRQLRYRRYGSYEDEKALLLHYRDRELELGRAIQSPAWSEMRRLPGVTNAVYFQSKYPSRLQTILNLKQLNLAWVMYLEGPGQRPGLIGRAADAETRRRIIIAAIALERYRNRHGSYPQTLQQLAPVLVKNPPIDFMDGQPLRYRLMDEGRFVLYSVGSDCVDNGGEMPQRRQRGSPYEGERGFGAARGTDLVWPRPAPAVEVEMFHREELKVQAETANRLKDFQAEAQWRDSARRQAGVEKLLAAKPKVLAAEPTFHGRQLSEVLRNDNPAGASKLTLDELLTLKQVATGEEPETVTFEAPINYNVLTNLGSLQLYVDPVEDEDSDEGCAAGQFECQRATNGTCRLVWNTIYESPGKHALQLGLELNEAARDDELIAGPVTPFVVSNLCQVSLSSGYFNPELGATLRAKLPEPNGTYTVEITPPAGERLKTITGSTSNGVIKVHWDLTDDHGRKCTNNAFDTLFRIMLPDSGRSQAL